jgi:hypothetical protein
MASPGSGAADLLAWLQDWYTARCDGEWENSYGVSIESLDNPGWWVKIDLTETPLAGRPFDLLERRASETDWLHCEVREGKFDAAGGPHNLGDIIAIFRAWCESAGPTR